MEWGRIVPVQELIKYCPLKAISAISRCCKRWNTEVKEVLVLEKRKLIASRKIAQWIWKRKHRIPLINPKSTYSKFYKPFPWKVIENRKHLYVCSKSMLLSQETLHNAGKGRLRRGDKGISSFIIIFKPHCNEYVHTEKVWLVAGGNNISSAVVRVEPNQGCCSLNFPATEPFPLDLSPLFYHQVTISFQKDGYLDQNWEALIVVAVEFEERDWNDVAYRIHRYSVPERIYADDRYGGNRYQELLFQEGMLGYIYFP